MKRRSQGSGRKTNAAAPHDDVIYDWNVREAPARPSHAFELFDETLRDGLQSPSVTDPPLEDKIAILELMAKNGIQAADLGLPNAGPRAFADVVALARHIRDRGLPISPACAARTVSADVQAVADAVQRAGQPLTVYAFIGSSPIRQWAEQWDDAFLLNTSVQAIEFAVKQGLEVAFVTEDTVRSRPKSLATLFQAAVDHGASRLVLCDTVGHATPSGASALLRWTKRLLSSMRSDAARRVKLEWHGHNDRGLAVVNALAALEAGAERLHGCGLGIGERVGNTSLDLLLLNLKLQGWIDNDLTHLVPYVRKIAEATRFPIPRNHPLSGDDAFRTASGVHAAAIIKAQRRGDSWLSDRVYSGVPAGDFGKEQQIDVGYMSGMSNVKYWLELRGISAPDPLCRAILERAKSCRWTLTDEEILQVVAEHSETPLSRVEGEARPR